MNPVRLIAVPTASAVALTLATAPAFGALPQQTGTVDLLTQANITITGPVANSYVGQAVAGAGDVNADGIDDVIIGARGADPLGRSNAGAAYVVFGSATTTSVDLAALGAQGFSIAGAAANDETGVAVAGAGDVNNDGIDDVVVGSTLADPGSVSNAGTATVVFGSASVTSDVDLAALGARGFQLTGSTTGDYTGASVAAAGDVNDDGIDDVIVGISGADTGSPVRYNTGSAVVIYGSANPANVALSSLGSRGFRINGYDTWCNVGSAVAGAGDFNADGIDDVIVATPSCPDWGLTNQWRGMTYVIYGSGNPTTVTTNALVGRGVAITGAAQEDKSGSGVAGVGDQNGDGTDDILIGAPGADPASGSAAGSSYVVYGGASPTSFGLGDIISTSRGFIIDGAASGDASGKSVAAAGDVNSDGIPDMIIGAPEADPLGRSTAGASYVVFGTATPSSLALSSLGQAGIAISGAQANDVTGWSVSGAGDVNGDDRDDVLTGAYGVNTSSLNDAGAAFVTFGFGTSSLAYPSAVAGTVGTSITPVSPTVARTGNATFAVSSPLPAGLSLNASTGVISGTPTEVSAATSYTVTMTDANGQTAASVQVGVVAAPAVAPTGGSTSPSTPTATPSAAPEAPKAQMEMRGTPSVAAEQNAMVLVTRINVNGAGRLAQRGETQAARRTLQACATWRTITRPGTYMVTCRLSAATRRVLATRSLRVRLVTSFRAADGSRAQRVSVVRIARTLPRPGAVTG